MLHKITILLVLVALAGCETPTPYQPNKTGAWAVPPLLNLV